ncbi:vacuole membrane protein 1 [Stylonychia lemnae]|uniref:Vacuole membrane protein 1 n=1 Tax=Stylonychia lemnae TaxID=5949 RepID=A0A078AF17_STYLE|nr:vacuole membrane protein 1 [Stylonychia lemnae]|eukprot:CDW80117.1 vacuole membrane protein 1 [Stylonychia lemnae]
MGKKQQVQQQQQPKTQQQTSQKPEQTDEKKDKDQNPHAHITLFRNPVLITQVLILLIAEGLRATFKYIVKHILLIISLASLVAAFYVAPGPHEQVCLDHQQPLVSSIIHRLYALCSLVGPHIAKVTMASNACNYVPESLPSRWTFHHFKQCPDYTGTPTIAVLSIYQAVIIEAFLWGLASLAGKKSDEFDEILEEVNQDQAKLSFLEKLKVPNPLFDLAGFLCGHFLVPFSVFFGATFIGKAIVKSFFVIFCFSQHQVDVIMSALKGISPKIQDMLNVAIEKQKKTLFSEKTIDEARPLVAVLWEYFVIAMVIYFIISIINSLVQNYLNEQQRLAREKGELGDAPSEDPKSKEKNNDKKTN